MLVLTRKKNEHIMIGEDIRVSVVEVKGDHVRIGISAPREVKVYREEVYQAIHLENKEAAVSLKKLSDISLPALDKPRDK